MTAVGDVPLYGIKVVKIEVASGGCVTDLVVSILSNSQDAQHYLNPWILVY